MLEGFENTFLTVKNCCEVYLIIDLKENKVIFNGPIMKISLRYLEFVNLKV